MQIRKETHNESLVLSLFPILLPRRACLWQMYNVTGRGKKKKSCVPRQKRACQSHFTMSNLVTNPVIQTWHHRPVHMVTCLLSLCQSQPTELKHVSDKSVDANPMSQRNSPPS